jgi:hypothetical protein
MLCGASAGRDSASKGRWFASYELGRGSNDSRPLPAREAELNYPDDLLTPFGTFVLDVSFSKFPQEITPKQYQRTKQEHICILLILLRYCLFA